MSRNEEPTPGNPLTYCERAYLLPEGVSITEAEAAMRFRLADLQRQFAGRPRGKFVNLALFDHRWHEVPERPPLIVLQWRDWRDEVLVDYPATQIAAPTGRSTQPNHDERLDDVFEALDGMSRLSTAADGLDFAVHLLERVLPAEAISGCIYDINTDELRFVALSGPSADALQGQAIPRSAGLFGVAIRSEVATLVPDVLAHPSFDDGCDSRPGLAAYNMVLQPLTHEGHLLGMLQLINRRGAPGFSSSDVHLLSYLGERLSEFLREVRARPH
jgi:GAF domain-containing protein